MPYKLKGNCVHKLNEDGSIGELLKCHATHAEALAHLRALYANVPEAHEQKADFAEDALPEVWVRAHPYGSDTVRDVHGEYFDADTDFHDELLERVPVTYYHSHTPDGQWNDKPIVVGKTVDRDYRVDGRWDKIQFFPKEKIPADIYQHLETGIHKKVLYSSPSVVPDIHVVEDNGHIRDWCAGSIAVFDAIQGRRPASWNAIGIPQMKALFKAADLPFPKQLEGNSMNLKQKVLDALKTLTDAFDPLEPPELNLTKAAKPNPPADLTDDEDTAAFDAIFGEDKPDPTLSTDNDGTNIESTLPTKEANTMAEDKTKDQDGDIRLKFEAQQNEMKAVLASNAQIRRELDQANLNTWFDGLTRAGKVMPALREQVVEVALQLKSDDAGAHPTMKFADGTAPLRLDAFKAIFEGLPQMFTLDSKNEMKFNQVDVQKKDENAKPEDARVKELLKHSPTGRQILAEAK